MLKQLPLILALFATPATADLYARADIDRVRTRAAPTIESSLRNGIVANLPRAERPRAAQIRLEFPEKGDHPMAFFSDPANGVVYMPLESIRFFDDISTLRAWFLGKNCQQDFIQSYFNSFLRNRQPLPSPLRAFAIDRDKALGDAYTNSTSDRLYSSGLLYILAHEVGHIMLGHQPGLTGAASRQQEIEADAYAMDHFARVGAMPIGALIYYLAAWWRDPVGEDVSLGSHPVSAERIRVMAGRMMQNPADFSHAEADGPQGQAIVRQVAGLLLGLAETVADEEMLTINGQLLDRDFPPTAFASACPS